jgi:glycosyltransferase involved in cell wall biosynthesis
MPNDKRFRSESRIEQEDLVTVVIPCYNQAHFLSEAIESVLAQDHPHTEVIVVDDGSTDNTAKVAAHYPQVHLIRQHNQGLSAARNIGLESSHGNYLLFLDADDRLLPGAIGAGLEVLRAHPECAFAFGSYDRIASDGSLLAVHEPFAAGDYYLSLLRFNVIHTPSTVMFRRAILVSIGGFRTSIDAAADYDLYLRITRKHPVCGHRRRVTQYRQHEAQMTKNPGLMLVAALAALRSQWEYVKADERRREAYKAGMSFWLDLYGPPLAKRVLLNLCKGEWRWAGRDLLKLAHNPRVLGSVFRRVRQKLFLLTL